MSPVSPVGCSRDVAGSSVWRVAAAPWAVGTPRALAAVVSEVVAIVPSRELSNPSEANVARSLLAAAAVVAYSERAGAHDHDLRAVLVDLVAGLRHLADAAAVDWDLVSARADRAYARHVDSGRELAGDTLDYPDVPDAVLARAAELFTEAVAGHHTAAEWADVEAWERRMWIEVAEADIRGTQ